MKFKKILFILYFVSTLLSLEGKADTFFYNIPTDAFSAFPPTEIPIKTSQGIINTHQTSNNKWYWTIPDSVLNADFFLTTTILKGSLVENRRASQRYGYGGDMLPATLISFRKNGDKILVVEPKSVAPGDYDIIYTSLDIVAKDNFSSTVDVTEFVSRHPLFTLERFAMLLDIGWVEEETSAVLEMKSYAENIIVRSDFTYSSRNNEEKTRWKIGVSLLKLPDKPLAKRLLNPRVGYFSQKVKNTTQNNLQNEYESVVRRWRLEPKPSEIDKYLAGELVEPLKPIQFYIDKDMPPRLKPIVKDAVENWNDSFEKAGFKNAIVALDEPHDSEQLGYTIDNSAYSFISYKSSPQENAYGVIRCDPRSGEIICSRVGIFHSAFNMLQGWYFSQCGNVDARSREWMLSDTLMRILMEPVITHEIGHALGLTHNFLGSAAFSLQDVRNPQFVKQHGIGTSIMDYTRYNHAARPEDNFQSSELGTKIGDYDKFAIEWAYRYFGKDTDVSNQTKKLERWFAEMQNDRRYQYSDLFLPVAQREDLSSDPLGANEIGILNLQELMAVDSLWNPFPNSVAQVVVSSRYGAVFQQYRQYVEQAIDFIGGTYVDQAAEIGKEQLQIIDKTYQQKAMMFLHNNFFKTPDWLINNNSLKDSEGLSGKEKLLQLYSQLTPLFMMKPDMLTKQQRVSDKSYKLNEYLSDIYIGLFADTQVAESCTAALQEAFVKGLLNKLNDNGTEQTARLEIINFLKTILVSPLMDESQHSTEIGKRQRELLKYYIIKEIPEIIHNE